MDEMTAPNLGLEIRRMRKWRGMTLDALAGLAGMSKGYLSKIENGHAAVERRSTLHSLASALRVSTADIVGNQYVVSDEKSSDAVGSVPDIRLALLSSALDAEADQPPSRPIAELMASTEELEQVRQACRDVEAGRMIPGLITDLHAVVGTGGNDSPTALRGVVQTTKSTTQLLKNVGAVDLAYVSADRGHHAAAMLDDPVWVAVADYTLAQALVGLGAFKRADAIAKRSADLLRSVDSDDALEVYGMHVLTSAFASNVLGADPEEALREARDVAEHTEGSNAYRLNFSATNVDQWRLGIALEADDPVAAAEIAAGIDPANIPSTSRRTSFLIDHARALHALRGRDDEVVQLLRQAEKLGTTRTRHSVWAREIVNEMLLRARRDAGGRELRGIADRMGVLHAA